MVGRPLCSDGEAERRGFGGDACARRRAVLRETLAAFERSDPPDHFHQMAAANLRHWAAEAPAHDDPSPPRVYEGDWGVVTQALTRAHGACYAVLNMANAHVPGGAYVEGAVAQEENLFRRTDCHFHIGADEYDRQRDRYQPWMTQLLAAQDGRVFLDVREPRVCIRGPEDRTRADLGYPWLAPSEVFPFLELRAAAQDLRGGDAFDADEARRRIAAQLDTLQAAGARHAVLSAFGCGAFCNPPDDVAAIYRAELDARAGAFAVVAFAIFRPGYGPDNATPFARAFDQPSALQVADIGTSP